MPRRRDTRSALPFIKEDGCQALGVHPASKYENEGGTRLAQLMTLLGSSDGPGADRDPLMKTACFVYLLAATEVLPVATLIEGGKTTREILGNGVEGSEGSLNAVTRCVVGFTISSLSRVNRRLTGAH